MTARVDAIGEGLPVRQAKPWQWLRRIGPEGWISGSVLVLILVAAILGHRVWAGNAYEVRFDVKLLGPSFEHPLGTDQYGRDMLARLIAGARQTLTGAVIVLILTSGAGLVIGMSSAILGGFVDAVIGRLLDMLLALPALIVALALIGLFGPSYASLLVAVSLASIPWYARVYRSLVLKERYNLYVSAAQAIGAGWQRVICREILPNIVGPALVVSTVNLARVILSLSALSFLGLGAQPPAAEWGTMISEARPFFIAYPRLILAPALAILLTVVSINLLSDSVRDLLDPRSRAR